MMKMKRKEGRSDKDKLGSNAKTAELVRAGGHIIDDTCFLAA